jgi:hypothetical protein
MEITKDIRKKFFEIKRTYGKVSIPWVQFKFHVTYEEAENMIQLSGNSGKQEKIK